MIPIPSTQIKAAIFSCQLIVQEHKLYCKMSYYAVIGSVPRFEIRKLLEKAPVDDLKDNYTAASWNKFVQARQAAEDILDVRIYDLDGYNNAKMHRKP